MAEKRFEKFNNAFADGQWKTLEDLRVQMNAKSIDNHAPYIKTNVEWLVDAGMVEQREVDGVDQFRKTVGSTVEMPKGKCQKEGCYEPSDCKHGFCKEHCHRHEIGGYSDRKYPRSSKPHVGVEVEVVYATPDDFRRGVGIECHRDCSLGSYGAEYKVLAESNKIATEVADLVQELWKRRARVNRSCGLHVHLDVRQLTEQRKTEVLDWMQKTEETWFSMMPPSRRSSRYANRMSDHNRHEHFTWAHVTSYKTIEIRLHGGTLNPYKIAGWLTALVHLQSKANDASYVFPSTSDTEADFWAVFADCSQAGKEYLATRKANGGVVRDGAFTHVEE